MDLFIFARFHARSGREDEVARVLREQVDGVRAEPGCKTTQPSRMQPMVCVKNFIASLLPQQ